MTGNAVIDVLAYCGFGVWAFIFLGLPGWALFDRLRPAKGEHFRPIGEAAPVASEAAVPEKRRSPFAPERKQVAK